VRLVIVTNDRSLAMPTREDMVNTAKAVSDELLRATYAASTLHHLDIRPLRVR
jgi:hypothetical protein